MHGTVRMLREPPTCACVANSIVIRNGRPGGCSYERGIDHAYPGRLPKGEEGMQPLVAVAAFGLCAALLGGTPVGGGRAPDPPTMTNQVRIEWALSEPSRATLVSKGAEATVKARAPGEVRLVARQDGHSAEYTVRVEKRSSTEVATAFLIPLILVSLMGLMLLVSRMTSQPPRMRNRGAGR